MDDFMSAKALICHNPKNSTVQMKKLTLINNKKGVNASSIGGSYRIHFSPNPHTVLIDPFYPR